MTGELGPEKGDRCLPFTCWYGGYQSLFPVVSGSAIVLGMSNSVRLVFWFSGSAPPARGQIELVKDQLGWPRLPRQSTAQDRVFHGGPAKRLYRFECGRRRP